MLKIAFLIATLLVAVNAQERRCEAPIYFESQILRYDTQDSFYRFGTFYYDRLGERSRVIEKTAENQTRPAVDILVLHRENKQFTVDLKTMKCTVSIPNHEFRPIGVPDEDHYISDVIIGTVPGDGVKLSIWGRTIDENDVKGHVIDEWTAIACLPVYTSFFGTVNGTNHHYRLEFFDVVSAEVNPNIFHIPKECL